jgi:molybdopterin synthase sulfur carrier subunit
MILNIKYFGMIAEAVGKSEEQFEFTGNKLLELDNMLKSKYSKLDTLNYKFAVNQALVNVNETLENNNEIALLPPFAGG